MTAPPPSTPAPRRVGRPARINRDMIAEAALGIGLEHLTLRAVADRLDVSIAALYHHVSGKDDLVRLAAQHSAMLVPFPQDRGQHWSVWLMEWAFYNHEVFTSYAGLLEEWMEGAVDEELVAANLDRIVGVLIRAGFTPAEAYEAYDLVSTSALGSIVDDKRGDAVAGDHASRWVVHDEIITGRHDDELPALRALVAEAGEDPARFERWPTAFERRITTVIHGIAAERGEDWAPIRTRLRTAARRLARA